MAAWRFLATGYESGAFNMAVDETLLQGISGGGGEPVFRVFGWNPPALSLGYGQEARKEVDLQKCSRAGIDIVRRLTGGRMTVAATGGRLPVATGLSSGVSRLRRIVAVTQLIGVVGRRVVGVWRVAAAGYQHAGGGGDSELGNQAHRCSFFP